MIRYRYTGAKLLFVGINPHPGSFARGVPFSNNKMFWYLLSDAGLIGAPRAELRVDKELRRTYGKEFTPHRLGFVNIVDRPTRTIAELRRGEEAAGAARLDRIIARHCPAIVCFVGKAPYEKYAGAKADFGWHKNIRGSRVYVMHSPIRGKASIRIRELRRVARAARLNSDS